MRNSEGKKRKGAVDKTIEKTGVDTERLQSTRLENSKHKAVFETEQGIAVTNALQQETEGTGEQ